MRGEEEEEGRTEYDFALAWDVSAVGLDEERLDAGVVLQCR